MILRITKSTVGNGLVALLSLAITYLIDVAALALRDYSSSRFNILPTIAFNMALPIAMSVLMLGLTWYLFCFAVSSRPAAYLYLGFGVLGAILFGSNFVSFPLVLGSTVVGQIRATLGEVGFGSVFYWAASCLLVLGIVGVLRRK